jgi:ParB family chromosome partitioning protein
VDGALSFGHARALAALAGSPARQAELAERCVREGMSVRRLEEAVRAIQEGGQDGQKQGQSPAARSPYIADLESQLTRAIGTKVSIRPGGGRHRGRIVIEYYSLDDFDRIVAALGAKIES